jgi:hypothetical protein
MDIFFQDPSEIPLPPEEVRIRELRAEPWPDGRRVKVTLEVDPAQTRPSAEVQILSPAGDELSRANIVESMTRKMEFTMHLRRPAPDGQYRLNVVLFFSDPLPTPQGAQPEPIPIELPARLVVDEKHIEFTISVPSG